MSDKESINLYGDKVVQTTGTHGADISSQRMDDLDRKCIEYALKLGTESSFSVDIGCGLGIQGVRLAVIGIDTLLIDILNVSETVESLSRLLGVNNLKLLLKDARDITPDDFPKSPNIVISQRFIHYLRFGEAQSLISTISQTMQPKARLYISASGLHSELGDGYKDKETPIEHRYCELDSGMAKKHQIKEPVCLYSENDIQTLIEPFGFLPIEIWSSSFGNIKAIFERK